MKLRDALLTAAIAALPATAAAQTVGVDELWARYDTQATEFEQLQAECDSGDRTTTRVDRICRQTAEASLALSTTIEELLSVDDSLSGDDRELLVDGMLTQEQIAGALWVDLGECQRGVDILEGLRARPELELRPLVRQATEQYLADGEACLAPPTTQAPELAGGGPSSQPPSRVGPIVLLATGGGALIGGAVYDLAMGSKRSEFNQLLDECGGRCAPGPDADRQVELQDQLDGAKLPVALLYGGGGALAATGLVWMIVQGGGADDGEAGRADVSLSPMFRRGRVGVTVRATF
ncbi:MAG: hypothetical protein H6700_03580 [Myxococcales bacterium]|nr:hypothetical protein [Myxococcales bacterium]MCB9530822.1 hypothetical protein [Myxococcales bacterium]